MLMLSLAMLLLTTLNGFSTPALAAARQPSASTAHPVLAFYYPWYTPADWDSGYMPDQPTIKYHSSDDATIRRQVHRAVEAGITGFISSWAGPGTTTDQNFARLLTHSAALKRHSFTSTIYFESDQPALQGEDNIVNGLRYVISQYSNDKSFLHWHGKPVIFIWDPLGHGSRSLGEWASIRQQVDPENHMIWSAEGVDASLLDVFDGIHLYSAGYWGLLNGDMPQVDQYFRSLVDNYNTAHGTYKIWAAGVEPGYDDTHIPNRSGPYIVARNNGQTYHISWDAAISSNPEMITITSFNEWYEGSMIEPSVSYRNLYLDITRDYTKRWR